MRKSHSLVWVFIAAVVGAVTYAVLSRFAHGLQDGDAAPLSALAAAFFFGLRFTRMSAPRDVRSRARANLTPRARFVLLLFFGLAVVASLTSAIHQGLQGYRLLTPAALISAQTVPPIDFYAAKGRPLVGSLYTMDGKNGERFLVPLEEYQGRLLVIIGRHPPEKEVRVTGFLRTDVRAVQSSDSGEVDGPFRQMYREHMGLPPTTPIYFLDTAIRAGLNIRAISLVVIPLYLFLLLWGAPTRAKFRTTRRRLS